MQVGGGDVDEDWLYLSQARTVTSKGEGGAYHVMGPGSSFSAMKSKRQTK